MLLVRLCVAPQAVRGRSRGATDDDLQAFADISEDALAHALGAFSYVGQADGGERDDRNDKGGRIDKNRDRRGRRLDEDAGHTRRRNRCHTIGD